LKTTKAASAPELNADFEPSLISRLVAYYGSNYRLTQVLGVAKNYATRWLREGYLPEMWALEIEALGISDTYGTITAYTVLLEAAAVRRRRVVKAMDEERAALKAARAQRNQEQ
jgi:hypothetical protein